MSWKRYIVTPNAWKRLVESVLRTFEVLGMAVSTTKALDTSSFHFSTVPPEAPLFWQIASSDALIATRPARDGFFRFTDIQVLEGQLIASRPPQLIESGTRRLLRRKAGLLKAPGSERGPSSDHEVRRLIHRRTSNAERRKVRCF